MPAHRPGGSLAISHGATRARVVATLLGLVIILIADATPNGPLANLRNWVFDAYERSWPATRPVDRVLVIDIDGNFDPVISGSGLGRVTNLPDWWRRQRRRASSASISY